MNSLSKGFTETGSQGDDLLRRRRDVEPDNPFLRSSSSSTKPKKKAQVKPAAQSTPKVESKIDAVAMRKQMAVQREIEEQERKNKKLKEEIVKEVQKEAEEIQKEIPETTKETPTARAVNAGSMLFGVEQISDENASKLGSKIKENLLEKKTAEKKQRHRTRGSNKGGGRQPKVSKFNRRKYLEYKVDMRNMLEEFAIEDEHRSNILGQIWAKGERIGVNDALDFIKEKVEQGIIPEEMFKKLNSLLDKYSKRR